MTTPLSPTMSIRTIKSVMTPFPHSVGRQATADEAERMMQAHGIRHLPVKDVDDLVGVVSARDLRLAPEGSSTVATLMQADPYVVELGASLEDVLLHMANRHIACVLVTKEGRLAGIFTHVDACRAFSKELRSQRPEGGDAA